MYHATLLILPQLTQNILLRNPLFNEHILRLKWDKLWTEPHDDLLLEVGEGGEDLGEDGLGHVLGLKPGVAHAEENDPLACIGEERVVILE